MKLFKYKSVDYIEDIIINQRLYCSRFDDLNDPMEWAFTSEEDKGDVEKLIKDTDKESWRICCLSRSEQYGLMWSMYGDAHKGICIELEVNIEAPSDNEKITISEYEGWLYGDVTYSLKASELSDVSRDDITRVLFNKSKQWEHEQELRFVRRKKENEKDVYFPIKVNKIYLGRRIDSDKACFIEKLCKLTDIPCVRMRYDDAPQINYWNNCLGRFFE